jgi:hypothetical protein
MRTFKLVTTQEVEICPKILAEVFTEMFDNEQREFFEELAKLWNIDALHYQLYNVKNNGTISKKALEIMNEFGN